MSEILKIAFAEHGTKEIPGSDHNQRIVDYAKESGIKNINDDETPWCSVFVNWVCFKLNLQRSNKPNARSWVNIGTTVKSPLPGDIVIFWRESPTSWKGHVGFFLGFSEDGTKVFCLGGNQSNAVSLGVYDAGKVLKFVRVSKEVMEEIPTPVLKEKSKGKEVEKLQLILNKRGYSCGDVDGDFGRKTTEALKRFQADNRLTVDGIYGKGSADMLTSLMQA